MSIIDEFEGEPEVESEIEEEIQEEDATDKDYYDDITDDYLGDDGENPLEKYNDLLKQLTNFDPYLKDTFNNWVGLTWSETESKYVRNRLIEPILSVDDAAWCIGLLKTYTRSNNIITDIGREEYVSIMQDHINVIGINIGTNLYISDGNFIRVLNEMQHAAELCLMGAGDGKYTKFLGTTISRHETVNPNVPLDSWGRQNIQVNAGQDRKKQGLIGRFRQALVGGK